MKWLHHSVSRIRPHDILFFLKYRTLQLKELWSLSLGSASHYNMLWCCWLTLPCTRGAFTLSLRVRGCWNVNSELQRARNMFDSISTEIVVLKKLLRYDGGLLYQIRLVCKTCEDGCCPSNNWKRWSSETVDYSGVPDKGVICFTFIGCLNRIRFYFNNHNIYLGKLDILNRYKQEERSASLSPWSIHR